MTLVTLIHILICVDLRASVADFGFPITGDHVAITRDHGDPLMGLTP